MCAGKPNSPAPTPPLESLAHEGDDSRWFFCNHFLSLEGPETRTEMITKKVEHERGYFFKLHIRSELLAPRARGYGV
jgi:hypothetical protein